MNYSVLQAFNSFALLLNNRKCSNVKKVTVQTGMPNQDAIKLFEKGFIPSEEEIFKYTASIILYNAEKVYGKKKERK